MSSLLSALSLLVFCGAVVASTQVRAANPEVEVLDVDEIDPDDGRYPEFEGPTVVITPDGSTTEPARAQ